MKEISLFKPRKVKVPIKELTILGYVRNHRIRVSASDAVDLAVFFSKSSNITNIYCAWKPKDGNYLFITDKQYDKMPNHLQRIFISKEIAIILGR